MCTKPQPQTPAGASPRNVGDGALQQPRTKVALPYVQERENEPQPRCGRLARLSPKPVLGRILHFEDIRSPVAIRRRTPTCGVDSVNLLDLARRAGFRFELQPRDGAESHAALSQGRAARRRYGHQFPRVDDALLLGFGVEVEGRGGGVGEEVAAGVVEVGGGY